MSKITSLDELLSIERKGEYILDNDIDCKGKGIDKIIGDFSGIFDGNGHCIYNFSLSDEIWGDEQYLSLFGSMNRAKISNLVIKQLKINCNKGCYKPKISVLGGECSNCEFANILVEVTSSIKDLPFIYSINDCVVSEITYICNEKNGTIAKYL